MQTWQPTSAEESGYFWALSDAISIVESKFPSMLVPVRDGELCIFSDYSGQHKGAQFEAYSYLLVTEAEVQAWLPLRDAWRQNYLPDGRRLSFKKLRENSRNRAFLPFLDLCSQLKGNVVTFLVDSRIERIADFDVKAAFPDCFDGAESDFTTEKMFRVAGFLALVLAGLRREDQVSNWVSDHDEALETHERREGLAKLMAYLIFGFAGWRHPADCYFGTTESKYTLDWYEDLSAIPDIFAGAYCKLAATLPFRFRNRSIQILTSEDIAEQDDRASTVGRWLATNDGQLRHVLARLELDEKRDVRATAQFMAGWRKSC